jgi:hypothetical protein
MALSKPRARNWFRMWELRVCDHHPDDGVSKHLWNVSKFLPDFTAQEPRRQPSSYSPPWEPEISQGNKFSVIMHCFSVLPQATFVQFSVSVFLPFCIYTPHLYSYLLPTAGRCRCVSIVYGLKTKQRNLPYLIQRNVCRTSNAVLTAINTVLWSCSVACTLSID